MKRSTASPTGCGGAAFTWDCCSGRWPSGWASPLPFYIDMETGVCEHTPAAVMDRLVGPIRRPGDRPAGMATIAFCMRDRPGRFWPSPADGSQPRRICPQDRHQRKLPPCLGDRGEDHQQEKLEAVLSGTRVECPGESGYWLF